MRQDFSKDVMPKRFCTAWLSSIMISHVQNLFDENIFWKHFETKLFLNSKRFSFVCVCGRKEPYSLASILITNNAVITRTSCERETEKSNMPERAMCCARETHNLI